MSGIEVCDPRGFEPEVLNKKFAPRLDSLDGKTVYAVMVPFANTPTFMEQLREEFAERWPTSELKIVSAGGRDKMTLDPATKDEIAAGDAAVVGIGL